MTIKIFPASKVGWRRLLICVHDLAVVCAALPAAILLGENFVLPADHIQPMLFGTTIAALFGCTVFVLAGVHQSMWRYIAARDLIAIAQLVSLVFLVLSVSWFSFDAFDVIPQSTLVIFWLIAFTGLVLSRLAYGQCVVLIQNWRSRAWQRRSKRVLIFGDAPDAAAAVEALRAQVRSSLEIVGTISDRVYTGRRFHGTVVLGDISQLPSILASLRARGRYPHCLVHAGHQNDNFSIGVLRNAAATIDSDLAVLSMHEAFPWQQGLSTSDYDGLRFDDTPTISVYSLVKRLFDLSAASLALLICAPLFLLISAVSLLTMGAPVFFTQVRAGMHLHEFALHKFRTMHDFIDSSGRLLDDDERTSWFGSLLRSSRLDELPQFWNVLTGKMALVGPRPLLPRDMPAEEAILRQRYRVRPGITGWAQVNGGHQLSCEQKMALDLYYIRHESFALDLKILILTLRTVLFGEHVNRHAVERAKTSLV